MASPIPIQTATIGQSCGNASGSVPTLPIAEPADPLRKKLDKTLLEVDIKNPVGLNTPKRSKDLWEKAHRSVCMTNFNKDDLAILLAACVPAPIAT